MLFDTDEILEAEHDQKDATLEETQVKLHEDLEQFLHTTGNPEVRQHVAPHVGSYVLKEVVYGD